MEWRSLVSDAARLTPEEVARLEAAPDELRARLQLFGYHLARATPEAIAQSNVHQLWLIAHHPEIYLAPHDRIFKRAFPEAHEEGKRLWLAAVEARPGDLRVLHNAISYLRHDDADVAAGLLRRGAELDPTSTEWPLGLARLKMHEARTAETAEARRAAGAEALGCFERVFEHELADPTGRYQSHIDIATAACDAGASARATEAASYLLEHAHHFAGTWIHGNGIYYAHSALGRVALAAGDVATARTHLAAAAATPGSPQLNNFGPDCALAAALFAAGEVDAVVAFLWACQRFWRNGRALLAHWQEMITCGKTPSFNRMETLR